MLNQCILVGRVLTIDDCGIVITVTNGKIEQNIPIRVSENILNNVKEYCKTGDVIGIKGMINMMGTSITIMADKITFLASKTAEGGE
jgi:predicted fused transcriptional regulator/phosphomethylpyrimidine kinase